MGKDLLVAVARHGQTESNVKMVWVGNGDDPLNETGRVQAVKLAKELEGFKFDYVISSDKRRSIETAEIVAQEIKAKYFGQEKLLRDRNYGEVEGMTTGEVLSKYGIAMGSLSNDLDHLKGTEKAEHVQERVRRFVGIAEDKFSGKGIVLITHGAFIRSFYTLYVGTPTNLRFLNCSNFVLRFFDGKATLVRDLKGL